VTVIHRNPAVQPDQPGPDGLVRCAQFTRTPAIGKCPRGATEDAIDSTFGNAFGRETTIDQVVWPAAPISPEALAAVAAGLAARRRPFSVLRLTGVPLAMLRRVVALP
jgi:hypothetical protein